MPIASTFGSGYGRVRGALNLSESFAACEQKKHPEWGAFLLVQLSISNPPLSHHQTRAQHKRVTAEKEAQRRECALTFEKSWSKRYRACSDVVRVTGLEEIIVLPPSSRRQTDAHRASALYGFESGFLLYKIKKRPEGLFFILVRVTGLEPARSRVGT